MVWPRRNLVVENSINALAVLWFCPPTMFHRRVCLLSYKVRNLEGRTDEAKRQRLEPTDLKNSTGSCNSLLWWTGFEAIWRPSWKDHPKLGVCKQIILWGFWNRFRMQSICFFRQLQTYILLNYFVRFTVCFYCCQQVQVMLNRENIYIYLAQKC